MPQPIKVSKPVFDYHKQVFNSLETSLRKRYPLTTNYEFMAKIDAKFTREALVKMMISGFKQNIKPAIIANNILKQIN